ncbi:hypothetical protein C4D60_Mb11t13480 [Musa balbisiana]|uniref:HMA domain-containing protein n=1 Tax=Musa balbisiana TaxID=52838 RepID=A0A4S8J4R9_MUSBA|nr:hypothetical protein C4D60_Mb11t13480 [Musa balbisiana]
MLCCVPEENKEGVDTIDLDVKERKVTVVGTADPAILIKKLRKARKIAELLVSKENDESIKEGGGEDGEESNDPKKKNKKKKKKKNKEGDASEEKKEDGGEGGGVEAQNRQALMQQPMMIDGEVDNIEAYMLLPHLVGEPFWTLFTDDNPNKCSIM